MKKQSSVLLLVIMMVSFSVTGCNAAESLEHESQIESISQIETMQEDSNFMSSVFDDLEYSYTPNHSYQSYVRYLMVPLIQLRTEAYSSNGMVPQSGCGWIGEMLLVLAIFLTMICFILWGTR